MFHRLERVLIIKKTSYKLCSGAQLRPLFRNTCVWTLI